MYWKTKNPKKNLPKAERKSAGRSWRVKPKKNLPETKSEHETNNPRTFSLGNTGIRQRKGSVLKPVAKPIEHTITITDAGLDVDQV